jgi:hypothetical protein
MIVAEGKGCASETGQLRPAKVSASAGLGLALQRMM